MLGIYLLIFFGDVFQGTQNQNQTPGARDLLHDAPILGGAGYTLGLKGPQALLDTACSSALVAYGALVG